MPMIGVALVAAGFWGLDPVAYRFQLINLNTPDPADADFHSRTRPIWQVFRLVGSAFGLAAAAFAIVGFSRLDIRRTAVVVGAATGTALLANLLQDLIGRVRPNQSTTHLEFFPFWSGTLPTCFPSGEATTAFAAASAMSLAFPGWKVLWCSLAVLAASARLVNGAHYLSDVAGGALLGWWATRAFAAVYPACARQILKMRN